MSPVRMSPTEPLKRQGTIHPDASESFRVWVKIGLLSFGGPAGQIALMHRIVVEEKRWLSEEKYLHALNYCMLLPGPEAQQLATYIGWLLHGWRGGLIAGLLFVLPGFLVILALSIAYATLHQSVWLAALFFGMKAAVLAIVADACWRIGRRALKTPLHISVAVVSFIALFFFNVPFPAVVLAAGVIGFLLANPTRSRSDEIKGASTENEAHRLWPRQLLQALVWTVIWQAPFAFLLIFAPQGAYSDIFAFYSKMALVTFGGAYAVLSYVAQMAVEHYHWLKPGEMLDGLALAETTPGPLVLVLSFTGFLAAFRDAGALPPLAAGVVGAFITAWATFVPSFIWILAGAPYVERLRSRPALSAALSMITAAVVGVILNLAVWFALHVLFADLQSWSPVFAGGWLHVPLPQWESLNLPALVLTAVASILIFGFRRGVLTVLGLCALAGLVFQAVLGAQI
ncbi:chromate efflux transporter [Rhizobium sp. L1K21]|uniref:chromate efflux transporter n=1 Tax=Rhizobium sp. L1K21 TaxID=2954933 RepID=UPI002093DAB8|nr:chromate efflux transporter [Rhizobium sp. L1K21]MCO6186981.1 chromate efflux transporter [Rhizobium sp. L1K21]